MKQVLQDLKSGQIILADVPCPRASKGHLLIRSTTTVISSGTERMLLDFGKANPIAKAMQQPDKVRMVLDKIRTDGLMPTVEAVRNKLDQPVPTGYCHVGQVIDKGEGVTAFEIGDRVASNGKHAEMVSVPVNLCAKVPPNVSDEEAAFTVLSSIALQGIRLIQPTLGEAVVVTGLGLIGLLTVQILLAHGCRVMGIDFDGEKLAMAKSFGAETVDLAKGEDPLVTAQAFSRGKGVDAVILTAATKSSEPVSQAAKMCRKRGRIVLVGVTGLELSRADFYEKELSFQVSCSYGPGRYDPNYEIKGMDYPLGFVRWTEGRNFEAVLDLMAQGRLDVKRLISHRFPINEAEKAYEIVGNGSPSLGILLTYPPSSANEELRRETIALAPVQTKCRRTRAAVGFIGAGNYATGVLIPAFLAAGTRLKAVASMNGVSGYYAGSKFGFEQTTTASDQILADPDVNAVVIATRHDSHARLVCQALEARKHVFVEKPLALSLDELATIEAAHDGKGQILMVGFNRRFSPHAAKLKSLLAGVPEPKVMVMTVNAGAIPADHWAHDPQIGGGRILGEACHFIDLLRFLAGAPISAMQATRIGSSPAMIITEDKATFTITFADGSLGTVHYLANGHKSFPKERLEVFCGGRVLQLDNFRKLTAYGWPRFKEMSLWRQDKGQRACVASFIEAVERGGEPPVPFQELLEVSRVTIEVAESLRG